jgi:glycosyltransferase involved in cell wall biosynthesis
MVGTVGLRKGIPYVYQAARTLEYAARFRVVGPLNIPPPAVSKLQKYAEVTGAVPRTEVPDHYKWADVFLLPSLCEGSATVCYEALGHALPVVTTPNAGSIVRDEKEGFIVPIRDGNAIAEALTRFVEDRALLRSLSKAARERARKGSLEAYADRLVDTLLT